MMRWIVVGALIVAAFITVPQSDAFNSAALSARAVNTNIVTDANSYLAITGLTCTVNHLTGGACSMTLTNKGVKSVTFTAAETSDPSNRASAPSVNPSTAVAPGSSATVSTTISSCLACIAGQTYTVTYSFTGATTHVVSETKNSASLVITWS